MAPEEEPVVAPKGALMSLQTALEVALERRALNTPERGVKTVLETAPFRSL